MRSYPVKNTPDRTLEEALEPFVIFLVTVFYLQAGVSLPIRRRVLQNRHEGCVVQLVL